MVSNLEHLTAEIKVLHSKLMLLARPSRSGKAILLKSFGERMGVAPRNIGLALGRRLVSILHNRHLQTGDILHGQVDAADINTYIFRFLSISSMRGVVYIKNAALVFSCAASGGES